MRRSASGTTAPSSSSNCWPRRRYSSAFSGMTREASRRHGRGRSGRRASRPRRSRARSNRRLSSSCRGRGGTAADAQGVRAVVRVTPADKAGEPSSHADALLATARVGPPSASAQRGPSRLSTSNGNVGPANSNGQYVRITDPSISRVRRERRRNQTPGGGRSRDDRTRSGERANRGRISNSTAGAISSFASSVRPDLAKASAFPYWP